MPGDMVTMEVGEDVGPEKSPLVDKPRSSWLFCLAGALAGLVIGGGAAVAVTYTVLDRNSASSKRDQYEDSVIACDDGTTGDAVVFLRENWPWEAAELLMADLGPNEYVSYNYTYSTPKGFSGHFDAERFQRFFDSDYVDTVEGDCRVEDPEQSGAYTFFNNLGSGVQPTAADNGLWGLDRLDQRTGLNGQFGFGSALGSGVLVYVMDSGVLNSHQEFTTGRALAGFSSGCASGREAGCGSQWGFQGVIGTGSGQAPMATCSGHGTFVASNVAGQTLGVAKRATVVTVQVLDCQGRGSLAGQLAGIDWILGDAASRGRPPAIVTMSAGTSPGTSLNNMANQVIASGMQFFNSAGNAGQLECTRQLNNNPNIVTVAATSWDDRLASFSNFGSCVQVAAPGNQVRGAQATGIRSSDVQSGTSYAAPYAAGIGAAILSANPRMTPAQLRARLFCLATRNVLQNLPPSMNNVLVLGGAPSLGSC